MSEELEELRAEAEDLGIEFDGRWGAERLRQAIEEVKGENTDEPEQEAAEEPHGESLTVRSQSRHTWTCGDLIVPAGDTVTLTANQIKNDRMVKRVNRAIEIGVFEKR